MAKKKWVRVPFRKEVIALFKCYQGLLQMKLRRNATNNIALINLMKGDPEFFKQHETEIVKLYDDEVRGVRQHDR